jgi:hypothetical protein
MSHHRALWTLSCYVITIDLPDRAAAITLLDGVIGGALFDGTILITAIIAGMLTLALTALHQALHEASQSLFVAFIPFTLAARPVG